MHLRVPLSLAFAIAVVAVTGCHAPRTRTTDPALSTTVLEPDSGWTAQLAQIPYHEPDVVEHVIRERDTLWSIARRYSVSVASIERANPRLEARDLEVGRRILIPRRVVWPASGRTHE